MNDLRRLRYFVACAEELHFSRAAQKLGIAQPPLSQQIRSLEAEIGTRLFNRTTRGVELTEAGASLFDDARMVIAAAEQALTKAQRIGRGEAGFIRVGFTGSIALNPIVPAVVAAFRTEYPLVEVRLDENTTRASLSALRSGRLDVALIRPSAGETEGLACEKLIEERMLAAIPASYRLAARPSVGLGELAQEPFVLYPRGNGQALYDAVIGACQANGFSPKIVQEAPQMVSTISLVAAGIGMTIVPESMRQLHGNGVVYLPIQGIAPVASIYVVHAGRPAPAVVANFTAILRRTLESSPGM